MDGVFGPVQEPEISDTTEITQAAELDTEQVEESAPSDNESSTEPAPTRIANKYNSIPDAYKGIVNLAAHLMAKGELDEMPVLRKGMSGEELEAIYLGLSQGKRDSMQTPTQQDPNEEPAEETEETPPDEDIEADLQQRIAFLEALSGVPQQVPQITQQTMQQTTQQPTQYQMPNNVQELEASEPPVDLQPVISKYANQSQELFGEVGGDVIGLVTGLAQEIAKAIVDREGRLLAKGLSPVMQTVQNMNGFISTEQKGREFDRQSAAFFKAHPEYAPAKDLTKQLWLKYPGVTQMTGGKDPYTGVVAPSGIEFVARIAADTMKLDVKKSQSKAGLRVASTATKPRVQQKPDAEAVTRQQIKTPLDTGIWG